MAAEYKRFGKGGREVRIQATYNPIFDLEGKPCKVIKFATDIIKESRRNADFAGQVEAISKSQAVCKFNLDGSISNAKENFLEVMSSGNHRHDFLPYPSSRQCPTACGAAA